MAFICLGAIYPPAPISAKFFISSQLFYSFNRIIFQQVFLFALFAHCCISFVETELLSKFADPTFLFGGISNHQSISGNRLRNNRTGADECELTNFVSAYDRGISA